MIFHYFHGGTRFVGGDFLHVLNSVDVQYLSQKIDLQIFQKLLSFYIVASVVTFPCFFVYFSFSFLL